MKKLILEIWTEGVNDIKFLGNVISYWYGYENLNKNNKNILELYKFEKYIKIYGTNGKYWNNDDFESIRNQIIKNTDIGSINSLIFQDMDENFENSKNDFLEKLKLDNSIYKFDYFLFPINNDIGNEIKGDLEYLLNRIVLNEYDLFLKCLDNFSSCLNEINNIEGFSNTKDLTSEKYKYFEMLKYFKIKNRQIFNLNPTEKPILQPLKTTLDKYLN